VLFAGCLLTASRMHNDSLPYLLQVLFAGWIPGSRENELGRESKQIQADRPRLFCITTTHKPS